MIGPEPVIAIAGSQRAWAAELRRFLSDFGGARLKGTVLTAREALETGYEVLLIDDITSYLSPRLVERLRQDGKRVIGFYDSESGRRGRDRLRSLDVDAIVPVDIGPEAILEAVLAVGMGGSFEAGGARGRTAHRSSVGRITTVVGGDLAGDFALALSGTLRSKGRKTLLVDADTVTPMIAQRLSMPIVPNLLTALDAHVELRGKVQDSLLAGPYGMTILTGIPEPSEWETVRADEIEDLIETSALSYDELVVKVSSHIEDLSRFGSRDGRFEVNRAMVRLATDTVYVAEPTPVGLSRALRWISKARKLTAGRVHVVFGGCSTSSFQRGELSDELTRNYTPASITWLPPDQAQERSVWNGTAIPKGPFRKTIDKFGASALNGYAEPGS